MPLSTTGNWNPAGYQYLLFAADPYEVIAFKIPNLEVDRSDRFFSHWCARSRGRCCPWPGNLHHP